jgi:hypothetical protein
MGLSITHGQLARHRPYVRVWWRQLPTITQLQDNETRAATSVYCNKPVSLAPYCNTLDFGHDVISRRLFTSMHALTNAILQHTSLLSSALLPYFALPYIIITSIRQHYTHASAQLPSNHSAEHGNLYYHFCIYFIKFKVLFKRGSGIYPENLLILDTFLKR